MADATVACRRDVAAPLGRGLGRLGGVGGWDHMGKRPGCLAVSGFFYARFLRFCVGLGVVLAGLSYNAASGRVVKSLLCVILQMEVGGEGLRLEIRPGVL